MMISTNNFSEDNRLHINMMIDRYGGMIADTAQEYIANEGLPVDEAICESARTTYELGALFTALLSGEYIKEEDAFQLLEKGLAAKMSEEYDRW